MKTNTTMFPKHKEVYSLFHLKNPCIWQEHHKTLENIANLVRLNFFVKNNDPLPPIIIPYSQIKYLKIIC